MCVCASARLFLNISFDGWLLLAMDLFLLLLTLLLLIFALGSFVCTKSFFYWDPRYTRCAMSKEIHDMKTIMDLNKNNNSNVKNYIFNYQSHCFECVFVYASVRVCISYIYKSHRSNRNKRTMVNKKQNKTKSRSNGWTTSTSAYNQSFAFIFHVISYGYLFLFIYLFILCCWFFLLLLFLFLTLSLYHLTSFWTLCILL